VFLIDNILLAPARGLLCVFREIHEAAQQEYANEAEAIREQLAALYRMLEAGQITEADFDAAEGPLLDRLDALESGGPGDEEEEALENAEIEEAGDDSPSLADSADAAGGRAARRKPAGSSASCTGGLTPRRSP
jgi:hypothetical protein